MAEKKSWFQRLKDNVRDNFDANTQADQQRRVASGKPQQYRDEVAQRKGIVPSLYGRAQTAFQDDNNQLKVTLKDGGSRPGAFSEYLLNRSGIGAANKRVFDNDIAASVSQGFGTAVMRGSPQRLFGSALEFGGRVTGNEDIKKRGSSLVDPFREYENSNFDKDSINYAPNKWAYQGGSIAGTLASARVNPAGRVGLVTRGAQFGLPAAADTSSAIEKSGGSRKQQIVGGATSGTTQAVLGNLLRGIGSGVTKVATSVGAGAGENTLQQFIENLVAQKTYDKDRNLTESLAPAAVMGGLISGTSSLANRGTRTQAKNQAVEVKRNAEAVGNVRLQALNDDYKFLNERWQTANPQVRKQIEQAIKLNRAEFSKVSEGGYISDGKDPSKSNTKKVSILKPSSSKDSVSPETDGVVLREAIHPAAGTKTQQGIRINKQGKPERFERTVPNTKVLNIDPEPRTIAPPVDNIPVTKNAPGKDFNDSTNRYLGSLQASDTVARGLADTLPHKLTGQEAIDSIVAKDNKALTGNSRIDAVNNRLQDVYNKLYAQYKDAGFDMGYVDQYSPRIYKHPTTGEAIDKDQYLFLTRSTGRTISRTAKNVNTDALLYKTPQELLGHYVKTFEKAKAGREYFDALKNQGYIYESGTRPEGMMLIDAPGLPQPKPYRDAVSDTTYQGNYYATPAVAKKLNRVFGVDEGNKFLRITAKVASTAQDIGLSGGLPGTPANAFTFAQMTKELTAGKIRAPFKALWESRSSKGAQKYFKNNVDVITEMQKQGIGVSSEYTTKTLTGFSDQVKQADKKAGLVWDKVMSDPTFKRFMPSLQIETYKQIRSKYAGKLGDAEAKRIAADTVKNFYGLTDLSTQATRSRSGNDLATTVMFAPKYRESMVRFWVKNAQAIDPRNMMKPEYAMNVRFNVGATLLFAAMQAANMALNGTTTFGNPDGKKDKLIIPADKVPGRLTGDKDIGIPFLSSIATVPRAIATGLAGIATGNFKEAGKSAKTFLGYGIRPVTDLIDNENYFGSQIYNKDDSPGEKLGAGASYLAKAYQHPYIRQGLNIASNQLPDNVKKFVGAKDQTAFETISQALESPLRTYNPEYYKGGADSFQADGGSKARTITIKKDGKNVNVSDLPAYERFDKLTKYNKDGGKIKNAATSDEIDKQIKDLNTEAAKEMNTWREAGWPEFKPNTRLTKEWASYSKLKAEGKVSSLEENSKKLSLIKSAYIDQMAPGNTIREFMTLNTNEKVKAIDGGLVDKDAVDKAVALDNFFYNSGVTTQLEFSKKLRSALGYDTPGGKGGKKGKKGKKISISKPKAFSTANIIKSMSTSNPSKRTVKINPSSIIAKSKVAIKKKS